MRVPPNVDRCTLCKVPIWYLGGDPVWEGYDCSQGKPGTVGPFCVAVKTPAPHVAEIEAPACLECANDEPKYRQIVKILRRDVYR